MARITGKMLRARLLEQLTGHSSLEPADAQPDYSNLTLLSIPTDEAFVTEAYRRVLFRDPDLDGMQHFLGLLKRSRQMVVDALTSSPEAPGAAERVKGVAHPPNAVSDAGRRVTELSDLTQIEAEDEFVRESYRRILGREAEPRGLGQCWALLICGVPRIEVLSMLAGSDEARARDMAFLWNGENIHAAVAPAAKHALVDSQRRDVAAETTAEMDRMDLSDLDQHESDDFVRESYRRILGREADPEGLANFTAALKSGVPKIEVLASLAGSAEAQPRNIVFHFGGHEINASAEQPTEPLRAVPQIINLANLELFEADDAFVRESFRRMLGREADPDGLVHFLALLRSGVPKIQVFAEIAASAEGRSRNILFRWKDEDIQAAAEHRVRHGFDNAPLLDRQVSVRTQAPQDVQVEERRQQVGAPMAESAQIVDLTVLDQHETEDAFVRHGYKRIVGRHGRREELRQFRELLICGAQRIQILAHLAASPEARARNLGFLWYESELPVPRPISFQTRLRALYRRKTGKSRQEDSLSALQAAMDAARERDSTARRELDEGFRHLDRAQGDASQALRDGHEAIRQDIRLVSANLLSAHGRLENKCDSLMSEILRLQDNWAVKSDEFNRLIQALGQQSQTVIAEVLRLRDDSTNRWRDLSINVESLLDRQLRSTATLLSAHLTLANKCDDIANLATKRKDNPPEVREFAKDIESLRSRALRTTAALLNAQTIIESKIASGFDAVTSALQNGEDIWTAKLGEFGGKIEQLAQHSQDARLADLSEKVDSVAADIRIREEANQRDQMLGLTEVTGDIAGLRQNLKEIADSIRPPVLAGADVLVTKVDDFVLAVPREDWTLAAYYAYWGSVDQGLTRCFLSLLRPGMVVVDIGANVGIHSLHAARAVGKNGKVYSFEPTPRTFAVLQKNLELNGAICAEAFPWAVLDRGGEVPLYVKLGVSGLNSLFVEGVPGNSISVKAVTLDEVLQDREHVDIVKIDAEGAEPFIFRGMEQILARNPALIILLEFAPALLTRGGTPPLTFLQTLKHAGFQIRKIDDFTGDVSACTDGQLLGVDSTNLLLQSVQK